MADRFSEDVLTKARKLVNADKLVWDDTYPNICWVTGSKNDRYRVQTDYDLVTGKLSWITCTCPHGLNVGAGATRCYHAAAVLLELLEQKVAAASSVAEVLAQKVGETA